MRGDVWHSECVMGLESECLNVIPDICETGRITQRCAQLIQELGQIVPAVSASQGVFTGYGKVYVDNSHLELACAECDNPFALVSVWERLQGVVGSAIRRLQEAGFPLVLANCNHSGLLNEQAPTWGTHGNYLVPEYPAALADRMLPFLVSRVYTGAGGIHWPTGNFISSTRAHMMQLERGGGTTSQRAVHSTGRDEPLTSHPERYGFRYHTLIDDGVRSQFSLLMQHGPMALVLKAVTDDPDAVATLPVSGGPCGRRSFWLQVLRRFNQLAIPGEPPRVDPILCRIQDVYLAAADKYVSRQHDPPSWMPQVIVIWESTLSALRRNDQEWLGRRLDPWIKYRVFSDYLEQQGCSWASLSGCEPLAAALACINQNYHEFCNPDSVFRQLELRNELVHRVIPFVEPGSEREPFVPELSTRGHARARWIGERGGRREMVADWMWLEDWVSGQRWKLDDPRQSDLPSPVPIRHQAASPL